MNKISTKKKLRKLYLKNRISLQGVEFNKKSKKIYKNLLNLDLWNEYDVFHLYKTIEEKKEFPTDQLIDYLFEKDKTIVLPTVTDYEKNTMENVKISKYTKFIKSPLNILEPSNYLLSNIISPKELQVVFVPLLCFDEKGYRIGYGGGFYDRLLEDNPNCIKIGVSYFDPVPQIPELHKNDLKMNIVVTEDKIYKMF